MKNNLLTFRSLLGILAPSWRLWSVVAFLCASQVAFGQKKMNDIATDYLKAHKKELKLSDDDIKSLIVTDSYQTKHNGVTHVYMRQTYQGIEVHNANIQVHLANDGKVWRSSAKHVPGISKMISASSPSLSKTEAVKKAADNLGIAIPSSITVKNSESNASQRSLISKGSFSRSDVPVSLVYYPTKSGEVVLAWNVMIDDLREPHWWSMMVDASTGEVLDKQDWVVKDNWGESMRKPSSHSHKHTPEASVKQKASSRRLRETSSYMVIPFPAESPYYSDQELVTSPWNATASPFGWHDTDGVEGAEYTITRGNNVYAYEDRDADNEPGLSPDGGPSLTFDVVADFTKEPVDYQEAAITNLFYWNNIVHDVLFHYGFDESVNFQETNYTGEGEGGDPVLAEAQDGSGTNNANFSTLPDGTLGSRMQMFETTGSIPPKFSVTAPASIAGEYDLATASFGDPFPTDALFTGKLVLFSDGTDANACNPATDENAALLSGNIAVIDRGDCEFGFKVLRAEEAGAIAVIVCNNAAGAPTPMGPGADGGSVTIPSLMISLSDGELIKEQLNANVEVTVSIENTPSVDARDGDYDNGVVIHEYGHGISNRLTGGPNNTGCLSTAEQMGEGWSDYIALMLTMTDEVARTRAIGAYFSFQPIDGAGIRPAPYSPDRSINDFTYDDVANIPNDDSPHRLGFIWSTMLWDMTLDLIDKYGYDSDIINGTGGNNIALRLVMDGMKLQPCSPGFVDGRDAILLADRINNDGANQELIWNAFADRGLGFSADQGDTNDRTDAVGAFDMPDMYIEVDFDPETAIAGDPVDINAWVYGGFSEHTNVSITAEIPEGSTYVDGSAGDGAIVDGNMVTFPAFTLAAEDSAKRSFQVITPATTFSRTLFLDKMEVGDDSWVVSGLGSTWENKNWTGDIFDYEPYSGNSSWIAYNVGSTAENILTLKDEIDVTENTALSFVHLYALEAGWDFGAVEISIDGGSTWVDLGDNIIENEYDATIINGGGRSGFTGFSEGHIETLIDLSDFAGNTAQIRFLLIEDASVSELGWAIDDIRIFDAEGLITEACVTSDQLDGADCDEEYVVIESGINTAPTLTDITVKHAFNQPIALDAKVFTLGFIDAEFDVMEAVSIVSLPIDGTLTLGGEAVIGGQEISFADLSNLMFTPTADFSGTNSFTWNASDGEAFAATVGTVNVIANTVPVATAINFTYGSTALAITYEDFLGAFSDADGDAMVSIEILSVPLFATLRFKGNPVRVGNVITMSAGEQMDYTYTGGRGSATEDVIGWKASDGYDESNESAVNISIASALGANDEALTRSISIYPNPVASALNVTIENEFKEGFVIQITNPIGQVLQVIEAPKKSRITDVNIDVAELPAGVYILQVKQGDRVSSQKILKQ